MRGKGRPGRLRVWLARITPAYAGKSTALAVDAEDKRDHPRVCGEKRYSGSITLPQQGSPPRMRGKASPGYFYCDIPRITPAYAGKRRSSRPKRRLTRDHPRVCGEKNESAPLVVDI